MNKLLKNIKISGLFVFLILTGCNSEQQTQVNANDSLRAYEAPQTDTLASQTAPVSPYQSDITCPACEHTATEKLPTDVCLVKYTCKTCKTDIYPKEGDCCVFCSYGTVKCPSKQ